MTAAVVSWILVLNLFCMLYYPHVKDGWGATVYFLLSGVLTLGWIVGALYKVPLSTLGPVLGVGFPIIALLIGYFSGDSISTQKFVLLSIACVFIAFAVLLD